MARPMIRSAVIVAGGAGSRLRPVEPNIAKALVPIGGKPVLDHQLELCAAHGVEEVWLLTGHLGDQIEEHIGDGQRFELRCRIARESRPLGTAGGLAELPLSQDFFVLYGDVMPRLDLTALAADHLETGCAATLVVHPNDHPHDSDLVEVDDDGLVTALWPARGRYGGYYRNLVNAAVYALSPRAISHIERGKKQDMVRDLFPRLLEAGVPLGAHRSWHYVKDMGTPKRLAAVERDWDSGRIAAMSPGQLRPAVFLDRDGTLNNEVDELTHDEQLELLPRTAKAVRTLNEAGLLCVVVTNQPMVAKGTLSLSGLERVHAKLETLLGREGAYLDAIYVCPHHPEHGFPGEVSALKGPCDCRKPAPGMIRAALEALPIDPARSCIIGDSWRDIDAGRAAGIDAYGVRTGYACESASPDRVFDDVADASAFVEGREHR